LHRKRLLAGIVAGAATGVVAGRFRGYQWLAMNWSNAACRVGASMGMSVTLPLAFGLTDR
jgi:hypothetical protein